MAGGWVYWSGYDERYWVNSVDLSLQDCRLFGGAVVIGRPAHDSALGSPASVAWGNNLFQRVDCFLHPNFHASGRNVDFAFEARNNLFYDGTLMLAPSRNSAGSSVIKDNLFDNVAFWQDLTEPLLLDYDYNGYTRHVPFLAGLPAGCATHLITETTDVNPPEHYAPHEVTLPDSLSYQAGVFGSYYLPASLTQLIGTGSRTPAEAGLWQYTSLTTQVKDGVRDEVSIGLHFVAANTGTGTPLDSDSDGVPDYVADANGNGVVDWSDTAARPTPISPWTKANPDFFQVLSGTATELPVLSNDFDSDGRPFTLFFPQSALTTSLGTMAPADDRRTFLFTPAGPAGVQTFTYAAVNEFNRETSAKVTVFVNEQNNQPPVASDDSATMDADDAEITVNVVANDTDSDPLSLYSIGTPQLGDAVVSANQIVYTRATPIAGEDTFTYVVTDNHGGMAVGTVRIDRNTGNNHAPVATSYSTTAVTGQPVTLILPATDEDAGTTLTCTVAGTPQHGALGTVVGNSVVYTPYSGYTGPDSLTFYASDGSLHSTNAGILISVQRGNVAPVAQDISYTASVDRELTRDLYAYDEDGDFLTYRIASGPAHGTATLIGSGPGFKYTPGDDYEGDDLFTFTASDGKVTDGLAESPEATVYITVKQQKIVELSGAAPYQDFTFDGSTTYFVPGTATITLNGTTTIQGGTVVKYAYHLAGSPGPKLVFNGPVNCQTSPLQPAIFTGEDDDAVGAILETSSGSPGGWNYADVALEMPASGGTELKHIRVSYAKTAIAYPDTITGAVTDTLRHVQLVHCKNPLKIEGNANYNRTLVLENGLMTWFDQGFSGDHWTAQVWHLTATAGEILAPDPVAHEHFQITAKNSVFAFIPSLFDNPEVSEELKNAALHGDHNGFDGYYPTFGIDPIPDDPDGSHSYDPFAPSSTLANLQAWHYLREESPFVDAGDTISATLQADFARMTTHVPELLTEDITSSQTLGPTTLRDTDTPDLGYHYPVVDYVLNGATVNNATLNLDQGTILALTAPLYGSIQTYSWGLRLNPGGRLNVNGVPTNRVVFARLETVQERPRLGFPQYGLPLSLITFKGLILPSGTMVTPLPEARFRYADFLAPAGSSPHFGPAYAGDATYDMVGHLELSGCIVQGGEFNYEAGGPAGRTLGVTNTIFERSAIALKNSFSPRTAVEQLTAANNLFYNCDMWLKPASTTGANWMFVDNIFDHVTFHGTEPECNWVADNHHNAYVPLNASRLLPNSGTDLMQPSFTYASGPLGRYYQPANSPLINAGSGSAGDAGLYHFTVKASNVKEGDEAPDYPTGSPVRKTVDIGPHYLALVAGGPADSNAGGPDGVADFLADRNGNGDQEADEMPWQTANAGSLAIQFPAANASVGGVLVLKVHLGNDPELLEALSVLVDGELPLGLRSFTVHPALSCAEIEVDTRHLSNGAHDFMVRGSVPSLAGPDNTGGVLCSPTRSLVVANDVQYGAWCNRADLTLDVRLGVPSSLPHYNLSIFDCYFPKSFSPTASGQYQGTAVGGAIEHSEQLEQLGLRGWSPSLYTVVELSAVESGPSSAAVVTPAAWQDPPWQGGNWVASYTDDTIDYSDSTGRPILDPINTGLPNPFNYEPWVHGWKLNYWRKCGPMMNVTTRYRRGYEGNWERPKDDPKRQNAQTYPVRTLFRPITRTRDVGLLLGFLGEKEVRNFYGHGHGDLDCFMSIINADWQRAIGPKRFRFVFADGCLTAWATLSLFGAGSTELTNMKTLIDAAGAPDPEDAVMPRSYYFGRRPSLFLGWKTTAPGVISLPPGVIDPTYKDECSFEHFPWFANWHAQFLKHWQLDNMGALEALEQATFDVPVPSGYSCQTPFSTNRIPFCIWNCLALCGYANLRFCEYNDGTLMTQ